MRRNGQEVFASRNIVVAGNFEGLAPDRNAIGRGLDKGKEAGMAATTCGTHGAPVVSVIKAIEGIVEKADAGQKADAAREAN